MANEEQLAILRQGVEAWNAWRGEHSNIDIDLREGNLRGADLRGTDLQRADLTRADLTGADLTKADLTRADLTGADLQQTILQWANVTRADLTEADLPRADLYEAILQQTILQQADLQQADFQHADLRRADLRGAILQWTILQQADFTGADLYEADLRKADLRKADLRGAILYEADLRGAVLYKANLQRANLIGANFQRASLRETNMKESVISGTVFADVDLRAVQNLEHVEHRGPSTISIDTLYRSHGQIPESFLRGCGVPNPMIEYTRSLVLAERPIDYYSVFISYSSQDEAIAQRLHEALQHKGVRCWFAPHDLPIGTPIVDGIDEAIRIYDKLLIILSEASINSGWVEYEVTLALTRENTERRRMLFPIRLDDTVLHLASGWAAKLRTRHIGNFREWKDHDRYQIAFTLLLRDLVADTHVKG